MSIAMRGAAAVAQPDNEMARTVITIIRWVRGVLAVI